MMKQISKFYISIVIIKQSIFKLILKSSCFFSYRCFMFQFNFLVVLNFKGALDS